MHRFVPTLALLTLAATAVAGGDELVGDRPDFTESAVTIAPGRVQIEAGLTRTNGNSVDVLESGEVLARIGLDARTELRVGLGSWVDIDSDGTGIDGLEDLELGCKRHLAAGEGSSPELALIVAATLPTGGEGIGAEQWQPLALLVAEWALSDRVGLGTNLGWSSSYDGERFSSLWLSAALGIALDERAGLFLEGYVFDTESADADAAAYGDAGLTYLVDKNLQLDLRVGHGFDNDEGTYVGAGFVLRI